MPFAPKSVVAAGALLLAAGLTLAGLAWADDKAVAPKPSESVAFTIPAEDGYGIAECMTGGASCGQGIADAWCTTHGRTRAVAFGAADVTGGTPRDAGPILEPGAVIIRCD